MPKQARKRTHFLSANKKTKSGIVSKMVRLARKERLNYHDFLYVCQQVRKKLGIGPHQAPDQYQGAPRALPATTP